MKGSWWLYIVAILISACSELHVEDEVLPEVYDITPSTIQTDLPVVNINANPNEVFRLMTAYFSKIFVAGELEMLNYLSVNDSTAIPMEMEVRGRSSVGADFPLKSLGLILNQPIDATFYWNNTYFTTLPGHQVNTFRGFRLRSSGNDFGYTQLKDLAYSRLAAECGLNVELMYGAPVQVFINNQYYGLMNLRTESNALGIADLIQEDSAQITVLKVKDESENLKLDEGNLDNAMPLLEAIKTADQEGIIREVDEANFMDYIIYQEYIGNTDWANNIKAYKVTGLPFRFILFDLDFAGNAGGIKLIPKMEFLSADIAKIYRAFNSQPHFEKCLSERQRELYQRFSVAKFNAIVDQLAAEIDNEIPYLIAKYKRPESKLHWQMALEHLKLDFEGRDAAIRKQYNL